MQTPQALVQTELFGDIAIPRTAHENTEALHTPSATQSQQNPSKKPTAQMSGTRSHPPSISISL